MEEGGGTGKNQAKRARKNFPSPSSCFLFFTLVKEGALAPSTGARSPFGAMRRGSYRLLSLPPSLSSLPLSLSHTLPLETPSTHLLSFPFPFFPFLPLVSFLFPP